MEEGEPPVATEAAAVPSAPPSPLGSSSALSDFNPVGHSWIMVSPEAVDVPSAEMPADALPLAVGEATDAPEPEPGEEDAVPPLPPIASSTPASPNMLRETGDIVASLAVSEILSAESQWPLPLSQTSPPLAPLTCSDASYDEPAHLPYAENRACEARKLGALAFPPPHCKDLSDSTKEGCCSSVGGRTAASEVASDAESEADAIDELLDPLVCWGQNWARPLALVAVLLASHAACLLLGVAIGKAQSKVEASSAAGDVYLARRFSSGGSGTHARLCMA